MEREIQRQKPVARRFRWLGIIALMVIIALTISIVDSNLHKIPDGPAIITSIPDTIPLINESNNSENLNQAKESPNDAEEKISISLPYSADQPTDSIVPMGETIYHPDPPNPGGHPGIDFQWNLGRTVNIIACIDGEITKAEKTLNHNKYDVTVKTGSYYIAYHELENIESKIIVGAKVIKGQKIGTPGFFNNNHYNLHWELGRDTNRICPMQYFDMDSKKRIEMGWADTNSPKMKDNSPNICSNFYMDKN